MGRFLAFLVLSGIATGASAQSGPYDGHWGLANVPECIDASALASTCPALVIERGEFRSEESQCSMGLVATVPGFEAAEVYDFSCRGEGETYAFRALLHRDIDGRLTVLNEFGGTVYLPVGAPAPATPTK